jgi:predicted nucleic acid-binding protein
LTALARIGRLDLLAHLFGRISIAPEVSEEVIVAGRGLPGSEEVRQANWIEVAKLGSVAEPSLTQACEGLGAGERGTIQLAKAIAADLVLLDDAKARRVARQAGLSILGCLGVLEVATQRA